MTAKRKHYTTAEAVTAAADSIAADMAELQQALADASSTVWSPLDLMMSAKDSIWLLERLTVMHARENGQTWTQIGERLEVSRQAAQQHYGQGVEL